MNFIFTLCEDIYKVLQTARYHSLKINSGSQDTPSFTTAAEVRPQAELSTLSEMPSIALSQSSKQAGVIHSFFLLQERDNLRLTAIYCHLKSSDTIPVFLVDIDFSFVQ